MTLNDLGHEQKLALVALLKLFAMSDNAIEEGEAEEIGQVAEAFGDALYRELLDEVNERFKDETCLLEFLATIRDRGARDLIYGAIMEESMAAPSVHPRTDLLDWLTTEWQIAVRESD